MSRERQQVSKEKAKELGLELIEIIDSNELENEEKLSKINSLIVDGADINVSDERGYTPIHKAVISRNFEIVRFLVENKVDLNICDFLGRTALLFSVAGDVNEKDHLKIAKFLIKNGASTNKTEKLGYTPIYVAVEHGDLGAVKLLLKNKADPNRITQDHKTALYKACEYGHFKIAKLLIEKGVYLDVINEDVDAPLFVAIRNGHFKIAKLLIEKGADVNVVDSYGRAFIQIALEKGYFEIADLAIKNGADLTLIYDDGKKFVDLVQYAVLRERYKKLEEIQSRIKLILETKDAVSKEIEIDRTSIILNDLLQKSLESGYFKEGFKNFIKSQMKNFIKKDETDKIEKLLEFLSHNKSLMSEEEISCYKTSIDQYHYIKSVALREIIKNKAALKLVSIFSYVKDEKSLIIDIFNPLIEDFKNAFLKSDFIKTSKIYKNMVKFDENYGSISLEEIMQKELEEGSDTPEYEVDAAFEDGKSLSDDDSDDDSDYDSDHHGGVEETKGDDEDGSKSHHITHTIEAGSTESEQVIADSESADSSTTNFQSLDSGGVDGYQAHSVYGQSQSAGYLGTLGAGAGAGSGAGGPVAEVIDYSVAWHGNTLDVVGNTELDGNA